MFEKAKPLLATDSKYHTQLIPKSQSKRSLDQIKEDQASKTQELIDEVDSKMQRSNYKRTKSADPTSSGQTGDRKNPSETYI